MINIGQFNQLKVVRTVDFGVYLEDEADGILLPKRFVPNGTKKGDVVNAFIYHDGEGRLIATTQQPKGVVGDIVALKVRTTTSFGAFLDNGIMKDVFVPRSNQLNEMLPNKDYVVKIEIDKVSNRMVATQKLDAFLTNENHNLKELEVVDLMLYRETNIGYMCIINKTNLGLLHKNEVFTKINIGDSFKGYIKKIYPEDVTSKLRIKIDVGIGKMGYTKVEDELEKVMRMLQENKGYLPYHDKSNPEEIYSFFGMSKKTFKMTTGSLFKQRKIEFVES
jgi:predicted RNA-binding protein (virulence factor B family)